MGREQIGYVAITFILLLAVAGTVMADDPSEEDRPLKMSRHGKWDLIIAPYGWLTGTAGTVVTDGDETEIDIPFQEFLENTRAGLQVYFEARRNRFILAFDGTWALLGNEVEGTLVDLDFDTVEGSGMDRNGTDLRQNGPIIGTAIRL